MHRLKSIKLYFFSILKLFFLSFRNFYLSSNFYNKKLVTIIPERIFYNPSSYLTTSLITTSTDFYNIKNNSPKSLWETNINDKQKFENLHSFLWLAVLDRKNNKIATKDIIKSWTDNFFNYESKTWEMETTAKRIIAWSSNTDITLENSDKAYREKFYVSIIKQSNFLIKNLKNLFYDPSKIICCSAIILSGMIFKENNSNYKIGIRELERIIKNYFDKDGFPRSKNPEEVFICIKYFFDENGFPKTRNPEDVFVCLKYLILIREWLKEAQRPIPDFLNEIINKCGNCYALLCCSNKQFPLFNGATEIDHKDYDIFLKNLKYKFTSKNHEIADLIKIKKKKGRIFYRLWKSTS